MIIWSLVIRENCSGTHCVEGDLSAGGHNQVVKVLDLIVCIRCVVGAQAHARPVKYVLKGNSRNSHFPSKAFVTV